MERIVLIGFGGHSKSVIDAIEKRQEYEIAGVLEMPGKEEQEYRGYRVIGTDDRLEELYRAGIKNAFVTLGFMGNSRVRNRIYQKLKEIGFSLPVIIDPSAVLAGDVRIGEGTFVGKCAVINADVSAGRMCIINTGAILEHEVSVGDFSHISVGTTLCGQVSAGTNVFVGASSTVIQGITIGDGSIIGAGTTVVRNVDSNMLVYGSVRKYQTGEE